MQKSLFARLYPAKNTIPTKINIPGGFFSVKKEIAVDKKGGKYSSEFGGLSRALQTESFANWNYTYLLVCQKILTLYKNAFVVL